MDNNSRNFYSIVIGISTGVMFGLDPKFATSLVVSSIILLWSGWPQRTFEKWLLRRDNTAELLSVVAVFGAIASIIHATITRL